VVAAARARQALRLGRTGETFVDWEGSLWPEAPGSISAEHGIGTRIAKRARNSTGVITRWVLPRRGVFK
jgi:hypothetical protein